MKKIILTFMFSALLVAGQLTSFAEESSSVAAVDGNVTISAAVDAAEGTPVLIFILPAITEDDNDVTAERVQNITTSEILKTTNVEYIGLGYVSSEGKVVHICEMKDSLTTGMCHVVFSFLGTESCYSAGTFEHVGEDDKTALLTALNGADKDTCALVIDEDINGELDTDGETRLEPKEILRKSSADVAYYSSLSKPEQVEFHEILYNLKGEESFDLALLIDSFNKAGVWMRLRTESDTLGVLNSYNGEGIGKYWNIAIDEESDFASLSADEKNALLSKIKTAKYEDKADLEKDFHNRVMLAMFRSVTTREDLADLISEEGIYGTEFATVREIISDAELNSYKEATLYNNVLEKNADCTSVKQIEDLFKSSIPKESTGGGGGGGGGGGSRPVSSKEETGIKYKNEVTVSPVQPDLKPFPFKDVDSDFWAYSYVKELYENRTINGISETEFAPGNSVKRQDFVKILVGALKLEKVQSSINFTDVETESYYAPFIATAYEKGLISGMENNSFGVNFDIKREDAAVIIDRVLSMYGAENSEGEVKFADIDTAAEYAAASIRRVATAGIFSGDENGNFNPKANLSRAEACAILCRLAKMIKEV